MKSIFNKADNDELIHRFDSLMSDALPRWGKMNVAQMLAHCQQPLKVAVGELTGSRSFVGILFGSIAKKKLTSNEPFPKNLPTSRYFVVSDQRDFERERENLKTLIQKLHVLGPEGLTKKHPFFGKMTSEDWDRLMWKHLDHHLQQFGA